MLLAFTTWRKVMIDICYCCTWYLQPKSIQNFQFAHELWLHVLSKGLLYNISLPKKLHVEKVGYMLKFQGFSVVSFTCLFPKVSSSCTMQWRKTKRWLINIILHFIINIQNPYKKQYPRGPTILSFDQNLREDTDEIKKKINEKASK